MEQYYIVMLAFLAVIAVIDIFVGVSNDASNFLNSALGCRIASFRTTMWVASLGVLLGATFSSGMMEVARSGIFHPQMFSFSEIMVVFFAVMVADVILLDAFNSLGLPTSTTVSIVFELLGSAAAAAAWKLLDAGQSLGDLYTYINTSKSLGIVSGILISVVVAFISGAVIQYLARLLFSFRFEGMYKRIGAVYGAFSITAIIYFLVMKGAKGASFMRAEWIDWINANTSPILITLFVGVQGRSVNFLNLMKGKFLDMGGKLMLETRAQSFIEKDGKVVGVKAVDAAGNTVELTSKAVILASGGYGADQSLLPPKMKSFLFYGVDGETGDGLKMGEAIGAATINMDLVKQYPQGVETRPHHGLAATASSTDTMKKSGAIYVNRDGKRFVDENAGLGVLTDKTIEQPGSIAYIVMDDAAWKQYVAKSLEDKLVPSAESLNEWTKIVNNAK